MADTNDVDAIRGALCDERSRVESLLDAAGVDSSGLERDDWKFWVPFDEFNTLRSVNIKRMGGIDIDTDHVDEPVLTPPYDTLRQYPPSVRAMRNPPTDIVSEFVEDIMTVTDFSNRLGQTERRHVARPCYFVDSIRYELDPDALSGPGDPVTVAEHDILATPGLNQLPWRAGCVPILERDQNIATGATYRTPSETDSGQAVLEIEFNELSYGRRVKFGSTATRSESMSEQMFETNVDRHRQRLCEMVRDYASSEQTRTLASCEAEDSDRDDHITVGVDEPARHESIPETVPSTTSVGSKTTRYGPLYCHPVSVSTILFDDA